MAVRPHINAQDLASVAGEASPLSQTKPANWATKFRSSSALRSWPAVRPGSLRNTLEQRQT
eukprot:11209464-Alexandrium_andersonii.AAC.1